MHAHTHVYTHIYTSLRTHTQYMICTHLHILAHMHTHTHAQTRILTHFRKKQDPNALMEILSFCGQNKCIILNPGHPIKWTISMNWVLMKDGQGEVASSSHWMARDGHISSLVKHPGTWYFQDSSKAHCICLPCVSFCSCLGREVETTLPDKI